MTLLPQDRKPRELKSRAAISAAVVVGAFLVLVGRLYHLQVVRGGELGAKSRENFVKELVEPADRGFILDRRGRVLAGMRPSFDVYVTPAFCKHPEDVVGRLALHLDFTEDESAAVLRTMKSMKGLDRFRPYLVKLDIDRDMLDVIEADKVAL
ncbi:MAG: hypothetical protein RL199_1355, partial [Pseudomonadota bacterium]